MVAGRAMSASENYRRYAVQCLEVARAISDAREKAFMIEMAQAWQKLADQAAAAAALQTAPVTEEQDRGD
jgi:uncharacterized protein with PhoU and TrkA domain